MRVTKIDYLRRQVGAIGQGQYRRAGTGKHRRHAVSAHQQHELRRGGHHRSALPLM